MGDSKLSVADYPLAEKRPELIEGRRGKRLEAITLEALVKGDIELDDLRITSGALLMQADIARAAGRPMLADNFARAAELVDVPQDVIMQVYELLRPGRAKDKAPLLDAGRMLRETYGATAMARLVEDAAMVYARRGLFTSRY